MDEKLKVMSMSMDVLREVGFYDNATKANTMPMFAYIFELWRSLPVSTIILAERPYYTDIFPKVASAISYDPKLSGVTPSTHYLAQDLSYNKLMDYSTVEEWFRESWRYLTCGVVVLNICVYRSFMDPLSSKERVPMERFIRQLVVSSYEMSGSKVTIIALGNPAKHAASRIRSSIPSSSSSVRVVGGPNPAGLKHKDRDPGSQTVTLESLNLSKAIASAIETCKLKGVILTELDFNMTDSAAGNLDKIESAGLKLNDTFDNIAQYFKKVDKPRTENEAELFSRASSEMMEFVTALRGARARIIFGSTDGTKSAAKQTYYNQRVPYSGGSYASSRGASTSVTPSTVNSFTKKEKVLFAKDDDEDDDVAAPSPLPATAPERPVSRRLFPTEISTEPVLRPRVASSQFSSSTKMQFADESDDDMPAVHDTVDRSRSKTPLASDAVSKGNTMSSDANMTGPEIDAMLSVSDFIETSDDCEGVPAIVCESLVSSAKSKRASPGVSMEVLQVIRTMLRDGGEDSVEKAIGSVDGIIDMPSGIMQWILAQIK